MAIFYKQIKGYVEENSSSLMTYVKWGIPNNISPTIVVDKDGQEIDLGYIITNKSAADFEKKVSFWSDVNFKSNSGDIIITVSKTDDSLTINGDLTTKGITCDDCSVEKELNAKSISCEGGCGAAWFNAKNIIASESISCKGGCDAVWFNATSDIRAKENIQLANYSGLDLIKNLPIYTFNYKSNSEKVTGILAQDLLKIQPDDLKLVSNVQATGENGDYMSIKNDKIIFILMKAIQEQQAEIEQLKERILLLEK